MKNIPLDLTVKQSLATMTEGGFSGRVEAETTEPAEESRRRTDGCWKECVLMEVHVEKLKELVGKERLRVQEEGGKDGIRSQRTGKDWP